MKRLVIENNLKMVQFIFKYQEANIQEIIVISICLKANFSNSNKKNKKILKLLPGIKVYTTLILDGIIQILKQHNFYLMY